MELESINWRKIHNQNVFLKAAEIYESIDYQAAAKDLLEMAHERSPMGRKALKQLTLLSIRMGELDEAKEYYREFIEIAPHDSDKYIMKFELGKAGNADPYTLIGILEELKENNFDEHFAYELAMLYRETGQADKCIELCDEISTYFGEGPYVERALELKMLFHPLSREQEEKYRAFQLKRDGLTEIRANEVLESGEIVPRTIAIPEVDLSTDRFNTINLQAEIKKNIEEIMQATEAGEISENMEAIKDLVNEIPNLKQEKDAEAAEKLRKQHTLNSQKLDETVKNRFQEYLDEEYDGQMSLYVPEQSDGEVQIDGQMSIEEVLGDWEKTRRAAEAALKEAEEQKLQNAKEEAIREATDIMNKLEDIAPQLDEGVHPTEIMKQEILAGEPEKADEKTDAQSEAKDGAETANTTSEKPEENPAKTKVTQKTFSIPKIAPEGTVTGVGLEIPVVGLNENASSPTEENTGENTEKTDSENAADEIENQKPAAQDQKKKKVSQKTREWKPPRLDADGQPATGETAILAAAVSEIMSGMESDDLTDGGQKEPRVNTAEDFDAPQKSISELKKEDEEAEAQRKADRAATMKEIRSLKARSKDDPDTPIALNDVERELFAYFIPIEGMERAICHVLSGAKKRLAVTDETQSSATGNIIIQGGRGSGKSTMASSLVKVLQTEIGRPNKAVGQIKGENLNEKDIQEIFDKIRGGCLIVENLGNINHETAVNLTLLMEADTSGILLIGEDTRVGIEKLRADEPTFFKLFTEKISIPIFSVDELVTFGKKYAGDEGYVLDEMAELALNNRIGLIQRLDRPTYLTEVKEIIDGAIENADSAGLRGFFGRFASRKEDDKGNIILVEKDFQE